MSRWFSSASTCSTGRPSRPSLRTQARALYDLRGVVRAHRGHYREAESDFRKALAIDPDNYTANFNLMILYQRTKDARAESQTKRFDEVKKKQSEEALKSLRSIEVRPYAEP